MSSGTTSLKDLTSGRAFQIPDYQRYYSWEEKQLEDLWTDLIHLEEDKKHYFGTVILKETDRSKETEGTFGTEYNLFEIIDGQQRLTTITILFKVMTSEIEKLTSELDDTEEIQSRIENIQEQYLYDKNVYMLELLDEDESDFFKSNIIGEKNGSKEEATPSQRRLWRAKEFFETKFQEMREESDSPAEFADKCNTLKQKIEKLELMKYEVGKEEGERATLIFESVNDRGKNLSSLEKTKSFLMHMIYLSGDDDGEFKRKLDSIRNSFGNIYGHLQEIKDTEYGDSLEEDDIQRFHYIYFGDWSKGDKEYQRILENLKPKIRDLYQEDKDECIEYIDEYTSELESSFQTLKNILTYNGDKEIEQLIERIHALRNEAKFYPLLIPIWSNFKDDPEELKEILKSIETAIFRIYAIGNHPSYTGETRFYGLAKNGNGQDKEQWINSIENIVKKYEQDEDFIETLKTRNFYNKPSNQDIRYLFFFYEHYLNKDVGEPINRSLSEIMGENYSIEHIWPQKPKDELSPEEKEVHDEYKHRLGNLTLASKSWNSSYGNKDFSKKQEKYKDSNFRVQRRLRKYDQWNPEQIRVREREIIRFVLDEWALSDTDKSELEEKIQDTKQ